MDDLKELQDRQDELTEERRELERQAWAKSLWAHFDQSHHGTVIQRLRALVVTCDMVERRGPNMRRDTELMIDALLNEWGPARTVKMLAWAAEEDARHEEAEPRRHGR